MKNLQILKLINKIIRKYWLLGLLMSQMPTVLAEATDFEALLKEAGLEYQPIAGFKEISLEPDYVMPYEKRLQNEDGTLEVRYAIRPLKRIEIDYDDPHNAAPNPNDLFEMLFRSLSETMAGKNQVFSRNNTAEKSRQQFNAGWSAVAVFDVSNDISKEYKEALLIAIHQNDKADAYILCLTNDLQAAKASIQQIQGSFKFSKFEKGFF